MDLGLLIRKLGYNSFFNISSSMSLSRVQVFATTWTVAYQAPPSMGFSLYSWDMGLF